MSWSEIDHMLNVLVPLVTFVILGILVVIKRD